MNFALNQGHFQPIVNLLKKYTIISFGMVVLGFISFPGKAQIAPNYEVATWYQFKAAALSYTFDDNTTKQLPVAIPLFDQYNFKTTLFTVTNWGPNWAGLKAASANGHEIASHTVTHPNLNTLTIPNQETELQQSQATINANITSKKAVTVAYPNCNIGDLPTIQKYYIAGRICSGVLETSTPIDFYRISSIIAGSQGTLKTADDFNKKIAAAKSAKGWGIFLIHGIDNDGGFSPLASSELANHLTYLNTNKTDYWVAPFADVVKYIKERNALSLTETTLTTDSLLVTVRDNLDNAIYDVPVTVRRVLPAAWKDARVYLKNQKISSTISTSGSTKYIVFDVTPDQGEVYLANAKSVVTAVKDRQEKPIIRIHPNPFKENIAIAVPGAFTYAVYSVTGKLVEKGEGLNQLNIGKNWASGAYLLKIYYKNSWYASKIIKAD